MAGISPIITGGFLFTPSLIVTAGFLGGNAPPPPPAPTGEHGGWKAPLPPRKKRKTEQIAPWERDPQSIRASLMSVVDAAEARRKAKAFDEFERQDMEDLLRLMEKMGL